jgi:Protein of unknown function (DUF2975)
MNRAFVIALRVFLIIIFAIGVFGQTFVIPTIGNASALQLPEFAYLQVPYSILAILAIGCVQVALVAVWMLLSMVSREAIFSERAFRWVDVIIGSGIVATALTLGVEVHVLGFTGAGGPGPIIVLTGGVIGGAAAVLLVVVMRGLLRKATVLQSELAEVV